MPSTNPLQQPPAPMPTSASDAQACAWVVALWNRWGLMWVDAIDPIDWLRPTVNTGDVENVAAAMAKAVIQLGHPERLPGGEAATVALARAHAAAPAASVETLLAQWHDALMACAERLLRGQA